MCNRIRANSAAFPLVFLLLLLIGGCSTTPTSTPMPGPKPLTPTPTAIPEPKPLTPTPTPTRLPPVLQLSAQSGDTVVTLTWQPMPEAQGYYIYRDGNPIPLNQQLITGSTFQDIGLTNGRGYRYAVAGMDSTGEIGPHSAEVSATPGGN